VARYRFDVVTMCVAGGSARGHIECAGDTEAANGALEPFGEACLMPSYRTYFRGGGVIVGRDEFDADADKAALLIARNLRDACSDVCDTFELWQGTRRVAWPPNPAATIPEQINTRTQEVVAEREMAIRDSAWQLARSKRLLDATRLLPGVRSS
jgi:hypothetical protein